MPLAYERAGTGPAVVLVHAGVCDRRMWQPQWVPLQSAGYQVIRPDLPGFGETPAPTMPYNLAEDLRDLLDRLDLRRAWLVGSSLGGRAAQEVAARWPERVAGLVLICAGRRLHPPTADIAAFSDAEDRLLADGDIEAAVALNVRTWLGPLADQAVRENVAAMQRHAFEVRSAAPAQVGARNADYDLTAITADTLVISGAHDLEYFRQIAAHLGAHIPGARPVVLDWAGHLPSLESPDRFNPILLDFLARSARAAAG